MSDNDAVQALSEEGAMCGEYCGDEPGDRRCVDCERSRREYVKALRGAGWAPRAEVQREAAEKIREVRDAYDLPEHHKIHGALDYAAKLINPEATP